MVAIKDFASNSVMGVVRKVVNYLCDTLTPKVDGAIDHLPARFNGTFNDNSRVLTMTIESQGTSTENLTAEVTIPGGGGSGGPTYSAGNGINITPENAIEIDTAVTATKQSVDTLQAQVGDAFTEVAIGADGKSLDFTALDGQVNNIALPNSGGSEWEQLDINNLPSDFSESDILKVKFKVTAKPKKASSWSSSLTVDLSTNAYNIIEFQIPITDTLYNAPISTWVQDANGIGMSILNNVSSYSKWNNSNSSTYVFDIRIVAFNGSYCSIDKLYVSKSALSTYVEWIYRKKIN